MTEAGARRSLAALVLVGLVIAASILGCAWAQSAAAGVLRTRLTRVSPVTANDELKPGYRIVQRTHGTCEVGSDILSGVYRCFAGNRVLDPCWQGNEPGRAVAICLLVPWSHQVIAVDVPSLDASPAGGSDIWAVQLASGRRCVASGGANGRIGNHVEHYFCGHGMSLLDHPDRSRPVWRIRIAYEHGSRLVAGPVAAITTAWTNYPSYEPSGV